MILPETEQFDGTITTIGKDNNCDICTWLVYVLMKNANSFGAAGLEILPPAINSSESGKFNSAL